MATLNVWYQCFAISTSPDPTATYFRYSFPIPWPEFNDYPKFGIWPDAYYMTANRNKLFSATGMFVAAFERASMLAGQQARSIVYSIGNEGHRAHMLPADWDGPPPPSGAPNYLVRPLDTHLGWPAPGGLEVWSFHVDWRTPGVNLTRLEVLRPAAFNSALCNLNQSCVQQPGTAAGLDPMAYGYLMYRLAYRNFGDHEALVLTHTVAAGDTPNHDHTAIRWYELRKSSASCPAAEPQPRSGDMLVDVMQSVQYWPRADRTGYRT